MQEQKHRENTLKRGLELVRAKVNKAAQKKLRKEILDLLSFTEDEYFGIDPYRNDPSAKIDTTNKAEKDTLVQLHNANPGGVAKALSKGEAGTGMNKAREVKIPGEEEEFKDANNDKPSPSPSKPPKPSPLGKAPLLPIYENGPPMKTTDKADDSLDTAAASGKMITVSDVNMAPPKKLFGSTSGIGNLNPLILLTRWFESQTHIMSMIFICYHAPTNCNMEHDAFLLLQLV
jgi:hypothetical protein